MISTLPKIVRFLDTTDAGEFGNTSCPHCGALGRYVLHFQLENGRQAGAMRGCVKLFPVSQAALEDLRLREKAATRAKKGWKLNRRDLEAVEALENFFKGQLDERTALAIVQGAKASNMMRFRR